MPDRNPTPESLDRELRELATRIEHPPTPDLARTARRRIEEEDIQPARRGWADLPWLSPQWAAAAAVLLIVLAIPAFSPAARDTLTGWFAPGAGGQGPAQPAVQDPSPGQAAGEQADIPESGGGRGMPESGGAARNESLPSSSGTQPGGQDFERKVIKTADLGIRSENVRRSAEEAQRIATEYGGSVQSSRIRRDAGRVSAKVVLSIPSPEFEAALDELRGLGKKVTTDSVSGRDVTEEFVDLESRERNLLAAEQSLLKLYNEAESVNDSLAIQRELTNVRGQIERVQGRLKYLEQRTDFSRIELNIQPVRDDAASSETGWSPLDVAARAWDASLGVLQGLATAVITAVVFSWWLIPIPIAGLVWWRRRHRASNDAQTTGELEPE